MSAVRSIVVIQTRMRSTKVRRYITTTLIYVALVIGATVFALPFLWMISSSLKPLKDIFTIPINWIPSQLLWSNYRDALTALPFGVYFFNTAKITLLNIIGSLFSCTLAAFGFARMNFFGKNVLFIMLLGSMMLPHQVRIIPLFILFRNLGWINTHLPLIVPSFFAQAFNVFLLRQYFLTIPVELEEAAIIDGAGYLRIFSQIFLPLSKPALITVGLFTFLGSWNDFFNPLIYLNSQRLFTVALGLASFSGEFSGYWHWMMAAAVTSALPCILIFFIFQRYFVEGIALTGLKG